METATETAIEATTAIVETIKTKPSNNKNHELPRGNYTLIGIDIDTTGRRLIDEIVQLAAYTPESSYSQYIMPLMNLNPAARQRHQVRVITVGFFRMLKSMQTYKVVKTKTEIAALNEFLDWIEGVNKKTNDADDSTNGVILIYHEQRKFVPYMMIEAFKKYNLLPRFLSTVKGFANGYKLAEEKCSSTIKYFSIRQLSKVLLNKDDGYTKDSFEGNAKVRAKLAFEIAQHLAKGEQQELSKDDETTTVNVENMTTVLFEHAAPISQEIDELDEQENNLKRQNSLRPVFLQYFRTTLYHRVKAVTFRRVLAENNHDLDSLTLIWTDKKKEGLLETVSGIEELKEQDRNELVEILDCHFDPEKQSLKPVVKRGKRRFPTRFQSHTIVRDNRPRRQNRYRSKTNKNSNMNNSNNNNNNNMNMNNNNMNNNNNNNNMNQQNNNHMMNGGNKSKRQGNNNNNRRKHSPGIAAGGNPNNKVLSSNL